MGVTKRAVNDSAGHALRDSGSLKSEGGATKDEGTGHEFVDVLAKRRDLEEKRH
jgi:hypothetical protein